MATAALALKTVKQVPIEAPVEASIKTHCESSIDASSAIERPEHSSNSTSNKGTQTGLDNDEDDSQEQDIPSRLRLIEPKESVLRNDIRKLAVYFAQVGFNTGLYIKNPFSQVIREKLDHVQVMRLVEKYNLKMNLDKKFKWISHPEAHSKLRIYHIALTYLETFIGQAAATSPVDFDEERFWRCAKNHDFWLASRRTMKHLNGRRKRDVRDKHSSSRLLSVAILPLLTRNEKRVTRICALSIEVRKGSPDRGRFNHFMRECLRHVDEDKAGKAWPELKEQLRRRFGIEEAEKELRQVDCEVFLELWAASSEKCVSICYEQHVSKPTSVKHMEAREPNGAQLELDLKVLAKHFCRLQAEHLLRECQTFANTLNKQLELRRVLELIHKYDILYAPVINQFSIKNYEREKRLSIDGIARDHLKVFIDTSALAMLKNDADEQHQQQQQQQQQQRELHLEEEQHFWRCANNLTFWQQHMKLARKCKQSGAKCQLSPQRLIACGFYRLLTRGEPKLIELQALRAPSGQYDYVKHNILFQIDKFERLAEPIQRERRKQMRNHYKVEEAEKQLKPITRELFLAQAKQLRRAEENYDAALKFVGQLELCRKVQYGGHARYLQEIEPDKLKLESELVQLARHFNALGSMFLLDNLNNKLRAQLNDETSASLRDVQVYKLAYKYRIIYSRVCNTVEPARFLVRLHRLANDHLKLFIETGALSGACGQPAGERRFWRCANNLDYFQKHSKALEGCEDSEKLIRLAPGRLVSVATFRLVSKEEPKLLALQALRGAVERLDRRLTIYHFETLKRSIENTNEKLNVGAARQLVADLRHRYQLEAAERELELVDAKLFIERWNETLD